MTKRDVILECVSEGQDLRRVAKKFGTSLNQILRIVMTEPVEKVRVRKPKPVR